MNLKYIWLFARDFISKKYAIYIVSVVMGIITLLLFSATLLAYTITQYGRKQCDELFTKGVSATGVFRFNTEDWYIWEKFIEEAGSTKEIYAIGSYDIWGGYIPGTEELIELQNEIVPELHKLGIPEDELVMLGINKGGIDLFNLKLQSGQYMEHDENISYVYLGADYSTIDAGTVFTDENGTCIVAGIFEKGSRIIDSSILFKESSELELDYSICLDDMVVFTDGGIGSNWITFSVNDGYSVEDGIEAIMEIGQKYGVEITWASCEGVLYRRDVKNEKIISLTRNMLIWMLIVVFIIMLCIQVSDAIERSGEFGIMYANGSSMRDISLIVIMENVRRTVIAFILWAAITFVICKTEIIPYYKNMYNVDEAVVTDIMVKNVMLWVVVFALAYICVMSIVPVIMVRKAQPIKLMGEFKI